jgi:hypothetical protein
MESTALREAGKKRIMSAQRLDAGHGHDREQPPGALPNTIFCRLQRIPRAIPL